MKRVGSPLSRIVGSRRAGWSSCRLEGHFPLGPWGDGRVDEAAAGMYGLGIVGNEGVAF